MPFRPRPINPVAYAQAKAQAGRLAETAAGRPAESTSPSSRIASFNGTYQAGLSAAAENGCCSPSDSTGAIGINDYVEMTNGMIAIYNRSAALVAQKTLTDWLGAPPNVPYCDPQIQWDPMAGRWFYSFLYCNPTSGVTQDFHFGWSMSADPSNLAGGWCHYGVTTDSYLMDAPKLGHDNNFLVVAADAYDISQTTPPFVSAAIWVAPKPAVGSTTCIAGTSLPLYVFGTPMSPLRNGDGSLAFAPAPANTVDSSASGVILAAHNGPGQQHAVMEWHLARNGDGSPNLVGDGDIPVQPFSIPSNVPQPGTGTAPLDSGDGRLTQAVARFDPSRGAEAVWTQHTIADPGGSGRAVVRWYEIAACTPACTSTLNQGNVSDATGWLFNGAISPTASGDAAVLVYNRGNASEVTNIEVQSRHETTPAGTMDPGAMAVGGSHNIDLDFTCAAPYGPPCRWGDYSGATPDISGGPDNQYVVWGASQLIGPNFCQCSSPNWETRVFAARAAFAPDAPTALYGVPGNGLVRLVWTVPSSNFAPITGYLITPYVGGVGQVTRQVSGSPPANSAAIYGLNNGTTYTFTVAAINEAGTGAVSQPSAPVTPDAAGARTVPPPPAAEVSHRATVAPPAAPSIQSTSAPRSSVPPWLRVPADDAVSFQIDPAHGGGQALDPLTPPVRRVWSVGLSGCGCPYALIAAGRVYALGSSPSSAQVDALDLRTGATAWGPVNIGGVVGASANGGIAYDQGRVFALNNRGGLYALDASSGAQLWSVQVPMADWWWAPPVATGGVVYTAGEVTGGTAMHSISAIRETDGAVIWTQNLFGETLGGAPAVSPTGVYVAIYYNRVYDLNPVNGVPLWRHDGATTALGGGGSGASPVLFGDRLYVRDYGANVVYDARTGRQLGTFVAGPEPAFSGSTGFFLRPTSGPTPATLQAVNTNGGAVRWSFTGDGALVSAPIVVNGFVYIYSSLGNLFAVDSTTGVQAWTTSAGSFTQGSYLAAGEGFLLTPSSGLSAYGN